MKNVAYNGRLSVTNQRPILGVLIVIVSVCAYIAFRIFRDRVPQPELLIPIVGVFALAGWSGLIACLWQWLACRERFARDRFIEPMAGLGLIDAQARWIEVNARL